MAEPEAARPKEKEEEEAVRRMHPACPVCADLLFEAFVAPCGHSVCSECKATLCENDKHPPCPECRVKVAAYTANFAMRTLVEISFAKEHKERKGRTVAGQIATLLAENPSVSILESNRQHADEFVLFLLQTLLTSVKAQDAAETIKEATEGEQVNVVVFSGTGDTKSITWARYKTSVTRRGMLIEAFSSGNPNPLKKRGLKRAHE